MWIRAIGWTWAAWLALVACDSESGALPVPAGGSHSGDDGGLTNDAGPTDDGATSMPDDAGPPPDPGYPIISWLYPAPADGLDSPDIIHTRTLSAACQVTASKAPDTNPLDPASIQITLEGPEGSLSEDGVLDALPNYGYQAEFSVAALPNGPLTLTCKASDTGSDPKITTRTLETYLDLGPTIEVASPLDDSRHALKTPVYIDFKVTPAPLADDDPGAEVDAVAVAIPGAKVPLVPQEDPTQPGRYTLAVDFDDRDVFGAAPDTAQITISATNRRQPMAATRSTRVDLSLDAQGPSIEVLSPQDQAIARGEVRIRIELQDPSGVRDDALSVVIPDTDPEKWLEITDWEVDGTTFEQQFDTRHFASSRTQLILNVKARDAVGNESTASVTVRLDNLPPLASLDPPDIREYHLPTAAPYNYHWCSETFDPVGSVAVNDGEPVNTAALFRALVWDQTNGAPGSLTRWYAGIDKATVQLFFRPADGTPLLVDTTDDGNDRCDEIYASYLSAGATVGEDPWHVALRPLTPYGTSPSNYYDKFYEEVPDDICEGAPRTTVTDSPTRCPESEMFRIAPQPLSGKPPGIFAFNPSDKPDTPACDGETLALGELLTPGGWVCLAVRAKDGIGNVGLSPPLRVCLTDLLAGIDASACQGDPPSCTDGCTAPPDLAEGVMIEFQD